MTPDNRFAGYLAEAVGEDKAAKALAALRLPPSVAVRFNPSKCGVTSPDAAASVFGMEAGPVPWNRYGFLLGGRPVFTLDPLLHAGAYYVQDSSAMFPGHVFRCALQRLTANHERKSPVKVLDLCAAPGGKTTDLAASLREACGDGFLLVSNEVMKQRAAVLADNVSTWGDPSVAVTSADPADFKALPGFFDIIVADVPCSGEGMFRKDDDAAEQWSPENVSLCAARQKRILADIWPALAPGGVLVYSTCTFNRYENDLNVAWAVGTLNAEPMDFGTDFPGVIRTEYGSVLVPGLVRGEGQYCAALLKRERGPEEHHGTGLKSKPLRDKPARPDVTAKAAEAFRGYFDRPVEFAVKGDLVIALPPGIAPIVRDLQPLHPLRCGCAAGQVKGRNIVPDADLALSLMLERKAFPNVGLSREQALAFLHRDTLTLPQAEKGFVLLTYGGCPLGFVKNLGNRCNSLLPPHRRIRMDITQKQQ